MRIQFTLLPWISLDKPYRIGEFNFWPYHQYKGEYLKDIPDAILAIDKIADCFKDNYYKSPLSGVVAVTSDLNTKLDSNFPEHHEKMTNAINLFAYVGITRESSVSRLFYDNYTPHTFNRDLTAGSDIISFNSRAGLNGMEIEKALILNPYHVFIQEYGTYFESGIFEALNNLYEVAYKGQKDEQEEAQRVIRSIAWFNISKYADPLISDQMMHASMAIALEALLGIPDVPKKSEALSHSIQLLCGQSKKVDGWAKDFYGRRNKILHGAKVPDVRYGEINSHIILSQIVFDHCLRTKLLLMKLWPHNPLPPTLFLRPLDYYLGNNKERFAELLKFKYSDLLDAQKLGSFIKLSFSINTDTDYSGDLPLYEKTIKHIVSIIEEGINTIEKKKQDYIKEIPSIEEEIESLRNVLEKIKAGSFDVIESLHAHDSGVFSVGEEIQFKLQLKHLPVGDESISISSLYTLLNNVYSIYEVRERRESLRRLT